MHSSAARAGFEQARHTFGQLRCTSSATMRALRRTPSLLSSVAACVCALQRPLFLSSTAAWSWFCLLQSRKLVVCTVM